MKNIIVNATALDTSGAFTILKQFVDNIPSDTTVNYTIFISPKIHLETEKDNVNLVPIANVKGLINRLLWDFWGVSYWLNKHHIKPDISISLQNTNFRTGYNIYNYIYYHQSIPFFSQRWSVWRRNERTLWFYKYIYPLFVKYLLNSRTEIFVQLNYIKYGFANKFHVDSSKIHVVLPEVTLPVNNSGNRRVVNSDNINLFYPATPFFYKNHRLLIDAIKDLKNDKIALYLTCNREDLDCDICDNIHFLGKISYDEVIAMYKQCDAMVFPSYIETLGLPLIEAASVGCPIIAADLPFAREVLEGYSGVGFLPYNDKAMWAQAISQVKKGIRYTPFVWENKKSWTELFKIINKN